MGWLIPITLSQKAVFPAMSFSVSRSFSVPYLLGLICHSLIHSLTLGTLDFFFFLSDFVAGGILVP